MDDRLDVRLVDTHTEGHGSHQDFDLLIHESLLDLQTAILWQVGRVVLGFEAILLEEERQVLCCGLHVTVDDDGLESAVDLGSQKLQQ